MTRRVAGCDLIINSFCRGADFDCSEPDLLRAPVRTYGRISAHSRRAIRLPTAFGRDFEVLYRISLSSGHEPLTDSRELGNKEFNSNDTRGPKSVSAFIIKLSGLAPRLIIKQMTLLAKQLDSEVIASLSLIGKLG